jgi:cell division protein FtsL
MNWAVVLLVICVGYVIYTFADQEKHLATLRREAETLRAKEATLKAETERLKQERQLLQTDAYIEKVAREDLGLVKPGETPYIMGQQGQPKQ